MLYYSSKAAGSMQAHLQNLPKEAHVLVQEPEAGTEAMHTAKYQGVVAVKLGVLS